MNWVNKYILNFVLLVYIIIIMCWNKDISLNTFLFSSFVLLLIMYNNKYTQYKIKELDSVWVYLFIFSFILMQLIEYFIWRNINDPIYNNIFSIMATLLLFVQPIASTMLIPSKTVSSKIITLYLILVGPLTIYRLFTKKISTTISPLNHLSWDLALYKNNILESLLCVGWIMFFLFPLFYIGELFAFLFGILTLMIIVYNYYKDGSFGSMWCWIVNSVMLYYAGYLLLWLPFFK